MGLSTSGFSWCGSVNCFIIVGESSTVVTLTATKDSEETILALLLWGVNHRIFEPSWKNYRRQSLHSAGDSSSAMEMVEWCDLTERPQEWRRNPEGHCMARQTNRHCYKQGIYLGRDPTGPLAPLGGPESLLYPPPSIWWWPHYQAENILPNLLLDLLLNLISNPLLNLLLVSKDFQLSRSCPWEGIILPQVQWEVCVCSWNFGGGSGVTVIFLVIFGFVGEMPQECWIVWIILTGVGSWGEYEFDCKLNECLSDEMEGIEW